MTEFISGLQRWCRDEAWCCT